MRSIICLGFLLDSIYCFCLGSGQFRSAVFIPQVFAITFGGMSAGIGAAIDAFLVDSIKHGYPYLPSLITAVPSNSIAFSFTKDA